MEIEKLKKRLARQRKPLSVALARDLRKSHALSVALTDTSRELGCFRTVGKEKWLGVWSSGAVIHIETFVPIRWRRQVSLSGAAEAIRRLGYRVRKPRTDEKKWLLKNGLLRKNSPHELLHFKTMKTGSILFINQLRNPRAGFLLRISLKGTAVQPRVEESQLPKALGKLLKPIL